MASPTSRCAMAKRVTESIISITFLPWSRKCSAIAVAVKAAWMRTSGGWSDVATTTTEWPSASPRSRSMNSRTSRPRSPTSAMTLTSAVVERALMPSSEDLPTPEPAKMPRRWPSPHGTRVSRARTPRPTRSEIRGRVRASGGVALADRARVSSRSPYSSSGLPRPSMTRPRRPSPTETLKGLPVGCTEVPGPMPLSSPRGISRVLPPRKPTTSVGTLGRSRPSPTRQISPISTWRPVASMIRPIRSRTRPRRRAKSSSCMTRATRPRAGRAKVSDLILGDSAPGAQLGGDALASTRQLRLDRGIDLALVGARQHAATTDAAVGLHVEVLDSAQLGLQPGHRLRHQIQVRRVDDERHVLAVADAAQRDGGDVDDALGLHGDGAGHDLLGDAQGQGDGVVLELGDDLLAYRVQRLGGARHRVQHRL